MTDPIIRLAGTLHLPASRETRDRKMLTKDNIRVTVAEQKAERTRGGTIVLHTIEEART
ncbi:MAG: hypothetical protein ABI377_11225 [Devosia sp.]